MSNKILKEVVKPILAEDKSIGFKIYLFAFKTGPRSCLLLEMDNPDSNLKFKLDGFRLNFLQKSSFFHNFLTSKETCHWKSMG